jgi:RNA polymerase sigma-70 factor (ECF subfamily)
MGEAAMPADEIGIAKVGQPADASTATGHNRWLNLPDAELVTAARQFDTRAFEALMRRYNRRLFRTARSVLHEESAAEDAVQEAYIRAFVNIAQYEPTGSFAAWLTRITINEALMLRRRQLRQPVSLEDLSAAGDDAYADPQTLNPDDESDETSARQLLERALDRLPCAFRTVFVLREVEQLSVAETAASLGINAATVKTRLHRARNRLRTELTRKLRHEQIKLFDFGGDQCDRIVARVLDQLACANPSVALS